MNRMRKGQKKEGFELSSKKKNNHDSSVSFEDIELKGKTKQLDHQQSINDCARID